MEFKTEKLLIRIAAVLGAIGITIMAILYLSINLLKTTPEMDRVLKNSGTTLNGHQLSPTYFVLTALSIILVISLFIMAYRLKQENYKIFGIILLAFAVISYWLLWFVPIVLLAITGILLLIKKENEENRENC